MPSDDELDVPAHPDDSRQIVHRNAHRALARIDLVSATRLIAPVRSSCNE